MSARGADPPVEAGAVSPAPVSPAPVSPAPGEPLRRGPIRWFAENHVAANLLMLVLMVGGLLATRDVRQEVFPEITREMVRVEVSYPGASPEEVEQGIVLAVEEAIRAIDGLEEIRARATEGSARVTADLLRGADVEQALNDVKSEIDRITTFPEGAERPVVTIPTNRQPVIGVILHGHQRLEVLDQLAQDLRRALLAQPEISVVDVTGVPPPEISIEVSQAALRRHGLTLEQVSRAISAASVDVPGGGIRASSGEILVRTTERRDRGEEFLDVVLLQNPDGSALSVRDVARVRDGFRETDEAAYFDGEPAVRVQVYRVGDQTPVEVAEVVHRTLERVRDSSPGVTYSIWDDQSEIYRDRIELLLRNAAMGLVLVLLVLGLFLRPLVAFWVTLGIPISFLGATLTMPLFDVSLNMISLFAFILALGIVVDDAIVVGEAVHAERQKNPDASAAAILGARSVALPVVFAVLTTVVAFAPLMFLPDVTGKLWSNIPMIVIPILLVSLVEALFILPAHLSQVGPGRTTGPLSRAQRAFSRGVERWIERRYRPLLDRVIGQRYLALSAAVALLVLSVGYVGGGFVKFEYMPKIEGDQVAATVQMPFGTGVEHTRKVAERLSRAAREVLEEHGGSAVSRGIYTQVGSSQRGGGPEGVRVSAGSHLAQVIVALVPSDQRELRSRELSRLWRERAGDIAGPERLSFQFAVGPGSDASFAVELRHPEQDTLRRAAADMAKELSTYRGVHDVDDGFSEGKPQLDVRLKPAARALGVTEAELGRQLRHAFFGSEAQRDQRGRDELRVYVRRPLAERSSLYHLDDFLVRTPGGGEIPLSAAADVRIGESFTLIERENASRAVDVSAEVDIEVTTPGDVARQVETVALPRLMERYPGLTWEQSGMQLRQARSFAALSTGLGVAVLVMFALMAMAFQSYVQPLVILFAIPFGLVGALCGHVLMGFNLSVVSVLGLVALSGVVVNDSLVLVVAANDRRGDYATAHEAIVAAGARRFRPVVLTSLTTFFGLLPMIFETSVQARFLIPMALSLGFGVLFVTLIALLVVPVAYVVVDDVGGLFRRRSASAHPLRAPV